jgi:hypothetical protein
MKWTRLLLSLLIAVAALPMFAQQCDPEGSATPSALRTPNSANPRGYALRVKPAQDDAEIGVVSVAVGAQFDKAEWIDYRIRAYDSHAQQLAEYTVRTKRATPGAYNFDTRLPDGARSAAWVEVTPIRAKLMRHDRTQNLNDAVPMSGCFEYCRAFTYDCEYNCTAMGWPCYPEVNYCSPQTCESECICDCGAGG